MADAELLFTWRCDPESRANSHYKGEIDQAKYETSLAAHFENPNCTMLIGEVGGIAVGHVRLDISSAWRKVSFMVAPEHRRKGFGRALIAAVMDRKPLSADVLPHNVASQRIFQSLGFRKSGTDPLTGIFYYTPL